MLYANLAPTVRTARVAILLDSLWVPRWVQELVDQVHDSEFADVVMALVRDGTSASGEDGAPRAGSAPRPRNALYWLYKCVDRYVNDNVHRRPVEVNDIEVVSVETAPDGTGLSEQFRDTVLGARLDLILALGSAHDSSDFASLAAQGILYHSFGAADEARSGPPLLWRIYDREAKAGTDVRVVHETPDGIESTLESYSSTSDSMWLSRHCRAASWTASSLYFRFLRSLAGGEPIGDVSQHSGGVAPREEPTNDQMASFLVRCGRRIIRKKSSMLVNKVEWLLAYRTDVSKFIASSDEIDLSGFIPIVPASHHVYADPCVMSRGPTDYVFFEDLERGTARGTIAVIPIENGILGPHEHVLRRDHHLSYPFVFEWDGNVYMLPETSQARSVQLFRATNFPYEWKLEQELLSGLPMVDATLHLHEDSWFLFVNAKATPHGSLNDELFLFFADTPLGPWRPHPKNPICSDVRRSRPAGRLFHRKGELIRPSQDCAARYGARINLCRVDVLSRRDYRESIVNHIDPAEGLSGFDGCHTFSFSERVEVIDVRRTISRFGVGALTRRSDMANTAVEAPRERGTDSSRGSDVLGCDP